MAATWGRRREPAVVSTSLIAASIEDEERRLHADPDVDYAAYEPTAVQHATTLRLSFKNLVKIENLESLRSLLELRIDNNAILRIEGLHHFSKLTRLDLSFNKISKIEGLEALVNLTDLSLAHNEISRLEGLDACTSLELLSLSHNKLSSLSEVLSLRQLPKLQALSLANNPFKTASGAVATHAEYRSHCLAFLKLRYLDYQLVTAADERAAREGGVPAEQLAEFEEALAISAKAAEREAARKATLATLSAANLEVAELLFDEMVGPGQDPELDKLRTVAGLPGVLDEFKAAFNAASTALRDAGLAVHRKAEESAREVTAASAALIAAADAASKDAMREWELRAKRARRGDSQLHLGAHAQKDGSGGGGGSGSVEPLGPDELITLAHNTGAHALSAELKTHEGILGLIEAFENTLSDHKTAKLAANETFFRAVESQQSSFNTALRSLLDEAQSLATRDADALDDDLLALVSDRDALSACVATSHEAHTGKLLRWEADLRAREEKHASSAITGLRAAEHSRNRSRVQEIRRIVATAEASVRSSMQL